MGFCKSFAVYNQNSEKKNKFQLVRRLLVYFSNRLQYTWFFERLIISSSRYWLVKKRLFSADCKALNVFDLISFLLTVLRLGFHLFRFFKFQRPHNATVTACDWHVQYQPRFSSLLNVFQWRPINPVTLSPLKRHPWVYVWFAKVAQNYSCFDHVQFLLVD